MTPPPHGRFHALFHRCKHSTHTCGYGNNVERAKKLRVQFRALVERCARDGAEGFATRRFQRLGVSHRPQDRFAGLARLAAAVCIARPAEMPSIMSDQSSSAISTAPSIRVNAVRRHLKPEGLERGSSMFDRLDKRRIVVAGAGLVHAR